MSTIVQNKLDKLSDEILRGNVVFFIGSGFSQDSEQNSTRNLLAPLFARAVAFALALRKHGDPAAKTKCEGILRTFPNTFTLETSQAEGAARIAPLEEPEQLFTKTNLDRLCDVYYRFNDWCCTSFAILLELSGGGEGDGTPPAGVPDEVRRRELDFLGLLKTGRAAPEPIPFERLRQVHEYADAAKTPRNGRADAGKALFLQTMGFLDTSVMAGDPDTERIGDVAASFDGRLRPRHFVLARLAREGLTTTLLTTNYDNLLEGAYRLSGFHNPGPVSRSSPPAAFDTFVRVAQPIDFYQKGESRQSATVVKIHGCVREYRDAWRTNGTHDYLDRVVFTYREIQNWREDSWSRDFLRTLLRTRTLCFAGYSGQDPVLHDTFRSVYEEQEQEILRASTNEPSTSEPSTRDLAFFFDMVGKKDFDALAILNAASRAAACQGDDFVNPDNLVPFEIEGRHPGLDHVFAWLLHLVLRKRQRTHLRDELLRLSLDLLDRDAYGRRTSDRNGPRRTIPKRDCERILRRFDELVEIEIAWFEARASCVSTRWMFERLVRWTQAFHPALRREFAISELIKRHSGPGIDVAEALRKEWYYPSHQRPEWDAWTAVVELAIRRFALHMDDPSSPFDLSKSISLCAPADTRRPTVVLGRGASSRALHVRVDHPMLHRPDLPFTRPALPAWTTPFDQLPWGGSESTNGPGALEIWDLAVGREVPGAFDKLERVEAAVR